MSEGYIKLTIRYDGETPIVRTEIDNITYDEFVKMVSRAMTAVIKSVSDGTDESSKKERHKLLKAVSDAMISIKGNVIE